MNIDRTDDSVEPARTLRLLWRASLDDVSGRRGPKPKVSTDVVVDAAIAIADESGIAAVTMRSVAERIGVGAMTLYGYVPGIAELHGLMIDHVVDARGRIAHGVSLRERVTAIADELFTTYQRHSWLVDVRLARPWIGPKMSDQYEWQLAAFEGAGLSDIEMDQVVQTISAFVFGSAHAWRAEQERLALAETDEEWWARTAVVLDEVMDPDAYPVSGRVGQAAGEEYGLGDAERSYRFGLEVLIAGLETH